VDRHRVDADPPPDPDKTFNFDEDPDPDPTPRFTHVGRKKKFLTFIHSSTYESEHGGQHQRCHAFNILNSILKFPGKIYSKAEAL
jgi:hypothetical protein